MNETETTEAGLPRLVSYRRGCVVSRSLADEDGAILFAFDGGEGLSGQAYEETTVYCVLEGTVLCRSGGRRLSVPAGTSLVVPSGVLHGLDGETPYKILQLSIHGKERTNMAIDLIKNIEKGKPFDLKDAVAFEKGKVVSMTLAQRADLSVTLFAIDAGEGLKTHSAAGDAMVVALEGEAEIVVGEKPFTVGAGKSIVMPATIPHSVRAATPFKMLLTVVKPQA